MTQFILHLKYAHFHSIHVAYKWMMCTWIIYITKCTINTNRGVNSSLLRAGKIETWVEAVKHLHV